MSTNFVYPGTKGNYKETDNLKPFNNYGWSKLEGRFSLQKLFNLRMVPLKTILHKKHLQMLKQILIS